jgi:hypothetical protein
MMPGGMELIEMQTQQTYHPFEPLMVSFLCLDVLRKWL